MPLSALYTPRISSVVVTLSKFFRVSSVIPGAIPPTNTLVVLTSLTKAGGAPLLLADEEPDIGLGIPAGKGGSPSPGRPGYPPRPVGGGLNPVEPSPLGFGGDAELPGGKLGGNGGGTNPEGAFGGRKGGNPPGGGAPGSKFGGKGGRLPGGGRKGAEECQ